MLQAFIGLSCEHDERSGHVEVCLFPWHSRYADECDLEQAVELCQDLIDTTFGDLEDWRGRAHGAGGEGPTR